MRIGSFVALAAFVALVPLAGLAACSSSQGGGGATAKPDGGGAFTCANPLSDDTGDAGASCATCLQSGCFTQLAAYESATTSAACTTASAALTTCAGSTCGPACGGTFVITTLDAGTSFSATCQTYVSCCVAANSAALLDAGITLASITLSCDQTASVSTDAECATATAEFLDAGVACH